MGNGYTLSGHTIAPLPWSEPGPPVLITAGNRGQLISAQIERFARLGDGIVTTYVTDDHCRVLQQLGDEALERHRRPPGAFPICAYTTVRISASVGRALAVTDEFLEKYYKRPARQSGLMGLGPADDIVEILHRYEEAGVADVSVRLAGDDQVDQVGPLIDEVTPAFASRRS